MVEKPPKSSVIVPEPPESEAGGSAARIRTYPPVGFPMKAELLEAPVAVGQSVVMRIAVERNGRRELFVVTASAPSLYDYLPYVEDARKAIARVVAEHKLELEAMFARMH